LSDLFGYVAPREPFADIRNQRPSVAEEKANLCAQLNALLRRPPNPAAVASVNSSRAYKKAHKASLSVLQNKDASRQALQSQISVMKGYVE
jgi:hypothetical protein